VLPGHAVLASRPHSCERRRAGTSHFSVALANSVIAVVKAVCSGSSGPRSRRMRTTRSGRTRSASSGPLSSEERLHGRRRVCDLPRHQRAARCGLGQQVIAPLPGADDVGAHAGAAAELIDAQQARGHRPALPAAPELGQTLDRIHAGGWPRAMRGRTPNRSTSASDSHSHTRSSEHAHRRRRQDLAGTAGPRRQRREARRDRRSISTATPVSPSGSPLRRASSGPR